MSNMSSFSLACIDQLGNLLQGHSEWVAEAEVIRVMERIEEESPHDGLRDAAAAQSLSVATFLVAYTSTLSPAHTTAHI